MDLNTEIELHEGDKKIKLPLINVLRFSLMYFTELRREFHMETGQSNISLFWKWLLERLKVSPGDQILK